MSDKIFLGSKCVHAGSSDFGKYFVCNSEALVDGKMFSGTGEGSTLEKASENAKQNLAFVINNYDKAHQPNVKAAQQPEKPKAEIPKDALNGGGNRPISEKQINMIRDKAAKKYENPDELANLFYQKPLKNLTGAEANVLIRKLL